jgi:FSR family fosmidomycin resistance protein-like MFS transporter
MGHFMNDFYAGLITPILFLFAKELFLTLSQQRFISFIIAGSSSFAQPLIGHIVDKKRKPGILILSVLWISFWMSISGLINNYCFLVFAVGAGALASALFHPLGSAVAISLSEKTKGTSLSIFMTIGSFAGTVSPMIALPIALNYGLEKLAYLIIPGIIISGIMYISQIHKVVFEKEMPCNLKTTRKIECNSCKSLSILLGIATIRIIVKNTLLVFGAQILQMKGISIVAAGATITIYLFVSTLGVLMGGILSDKFGYKKILHLSNLYGIIFVILFYKSTGILAILSFLIVGFSLCASNSSVVIMAQEAIPHRMNFAMGLIGCAGGIGGLGVVLYGNIGDKIGLITAAGLLVIPLIVSIVLVFLLPKGIKPDTQSLSA